MPVFGKHLNYIGTTIWTIRFEIGKFGKRRDIGIGWGYNLKSGTCSSIIYHILHGRCSEAYFYLKAALHVCVRFTFQAGSVCRSSSTFLVYLWLEPLISLQNNIPSVSIGLLWCKTVEFAELTVGREMDGVWAEGCGPVCPVWHLDRPQNHRSAGVSGRKIVKVGMFRFFTINRQYSSS